MKKTFLLLAHLLARHACLWAGLWLLATLSFRLQLAQAAVTESWVHRYNNVVGNSTDRAVKVVRDAAGDIIVTGSTDDGTTQGDMLTIKYSGSDGSVLWEKRYTNGTARALAVDASRSVVVTGTSATIKYLAEGTQVWTNHGGEAMAVDGGGNVVVTGTYYNGSSADYYTAKYAAANGALLWEQRYNGPANGYDAARAVAVDSSGNAVVTGVSYQSANDNFYTAKYAAEDGALLWEKRYNGPANSGNHAAQAVAVDAGGNVIVAGYSYEGIFNSYFYIYTAKYAAEDGVLLWEQRYNAQHAYMDVTTAVVTENNGNVVVTGTSYNGTDDGYYTAKYAAADGALLWEKRGPIGGAEALAVDRSGNVVVTGSSGNYPDYDSYTAKYGTADGALLWEKRGPAGDAQALAVDESGDVVVTGSSITNGNWDYYTAKYAAADSTLLWEKRYNGLWNSQDSAKALAVDGSGNVVVTGFSYDGTYIGYYTAKYAAADGALLWEKTYTNLATASALAVDRRDNVVVTGSSQGDYYTAKYAAANGALLWEQRYNGPANSDDRANAVAVDGSGNVVVTGSSVGNGIYYDYYTAKYAAADGTLLWEKRYNGGGLANSEDQPQAVAVDRSGNAVVTGFSYDGTYVGYYTAKYAAADGALLWEKRGPSGFGASALALDGSGNVVVTGSDYYTAKYAAADGALLWEKPYNGPAILDNRAKAVAVDGSGNVVVTGSSYGGNFNTDYYTAKYAAADGALVWEKRYNGQANNGPSSNGDSAQALALDGSGNVVVTGHSNNGPPNYHNDYYTAKYAAADGALLWEKRYNGPANGDDTVAYKHSLALGPNGMVAITGTSSRDYATVVYRENLAPVSIALVSTGIRLRFTGVPGRSYDIERAPSVAGPWTTINTQTAPASGLLEFVDAPAPPGSAFYRTTQP